MRALLSLLREAMLDAFDRKATYSALIRDDDLVVVYLEFWGEYP